MNSKSKYNGLPLSDALHDFVDCHPEFERSLKLYNQARFVPIPFMFLTRTPDGTPHERDQVIGMRYVDKENLNAGRKPLFKQDFVVNVESEDKKFISYTDPQLQVPPYVRPIEEFFDEYGDRKKFYHRKGKKPWLHYYNDVSDLPDDAGLIDMANELKSRLLAQRP